MRTKKWLLGALMALPFAAAGVAYGASLVNADSSQAGYVCPLTGEELPCPKCCPAKGK